MPRIPDEPIWKTRKIELVDQDGVALLVKISAKVMGVVAVHPAIEILTGLWSVTALESGLKILQVTSEAEALKVGEILSRKFVVVLSKKTKSEVVAKLPQWFKAWVIDSQKAGKGLSMESYEGKR